VIPVYRRLDAGSLSLYAAAVLQGQRGTETLAVRGQARSHLTSPSRAGGRKCPKSLPSEPSPISRDHVELPDSMAAGNPNSMTVQSQSDVGAGWCVGRGSFQSLLTLPLLTRDPTQVIAGSAATNTTHAETEHRASRATCECCALEHSGPVTCHPKTHLDEPECGKKGRQDRLSCRGTFTRPIAGIKTAVPAPCLLLLPASATRELHCHRYCRAAQQTRIRRWLCFLGASIFSVRDTTEATVHKAWQSGISVRALTSARERRVDLCPLEPLRSPFLLADLHRQEHRLPS